MRPVFSFILLFLILAACTSAPNSGGDNGAVSAAPTEAPTLTPTLAPTAAPVFEVNEWVLINHNHWQNRSIQRVNLGSYKSLSTSLPEEIQTGNFHITPDGQSIVYRISRGEIYQVPVAGTEAPRLLFRMETHATAFAYILSISETHIIAAGKDIYAIPLDGSDPIKLNPQGTSVYSGYCNLDREADCFTAVSPDQTRVAYFTYNARASSTWLYLSDLSGGEAAALVEGVPGNEGGQAVQFSPDSQYVVAVTNPNSAYLSSTAAFPVNGGKAVDLGKSRSRILITDDNRAIFASEPAFDDIGNQLFSASLQDGSRQPLIPNTIMDMQFFLSPDGDYVLYEGDGSSLRSVPSAGGEPVRLIQEQQYRDQLHGFRFSPDNRLVAYVFAAADSAGLYTIPVTGGEPTLIAESARGRIHPFVFSPNAQYLAAFVHESDGINLYSYDLTDGSSTRLNNVPGSIKNASNIRLSITADSKHVVYVLDEEEIGRFAVYVTPITGGEAVKVANYVGSDNQLMLYPPSGS